MWEPFYAAGHKWEIVKGERIRAKVAKAAAQMHSNGQKEGVSGVQRSERMPNPWKLIDNVESELT